MKNFTINIDDFEVSYIQSDKSNFGGVDRHIHSCYELLYIEEGTLDYTLDDKVLHLQKGDLLFINPATYHFIKNIVNFPYHRYVLQFNKYSTEAHLIDSTFHQKSYIRVHDNSVIPQLFSLLIKTLSNNVIKSQQSKIIKHYLNIILIACLNDKNTSANVEYGQKDICSQIIQYVNENLTTITDLDDLAKNFYFSKNYLNNLFKKHTNVNIMQFVRIKKILMAHNLILEGKTPTQAAAECGFNNYVSFYRAYKKFLKDTPSTTKINGFPFSTIR